MGVQSLTRSGIATFKRYDNFMAGSVYTPPTGGYYAGGGGGVNTTTISKMSFQTETGAALAAVLTATTANATGIQNPSVAGYVGNVGAQSNGGGATAYNKITFSTDTNASISATASYSQSVSTGLSNATVGGYLCGGYDGTNGYPTNSTVINKIAYSNDTRSTLAAVLGWQNQEVASGSSNSGTAGYVAGGDSFPLGSPGPSSNISKLTFSSDTVAQSATTISSARGGAAGLNNNTVAGYFAGGYITGGAYQTTVDKLVYSTDTRSTLGTGLSSTGNGYRQIGWSNNGVAGYVNNPSDKFAFATDTRSSYSSGLSASVGSQAAAVSNS